MAFTRLDCDLFRGSSSQTEKSSYIVLNAQCLPGNLTAAASISVKSSIGSQIASRISLEHFVQGVLEHYQERSKGKAVETGSQAALEAAFKRANSAVYDFGHKLAAGGRLACAMLGLVMERGGASAGRVGEMSAYLCRGPSLYPFFEDRSESSPGFVGSNSIVTIETATVQIQAGDCVFLFSRLLSKRQEDLLAKLARGAVVEVGFLERAIIPKMFGDEVGDVEFALVAAVGPETVYLSQAY